MALISCPECQREVSTEAIACPQCALPHPGRKDQRIAQNIGALRTCRDCNNPVSPKAQSCPRCGSPNDAREEDQELSITQNGEETWLCPHCSMPYTRRGKTRKTSGLDAKGPIEATDLEDSNPSRMMNNVSRVDGGKSFEQSLSTSRIRKKSPLWKEVGADWEDMHRHSPPQKRWGLIVLILVMILLSVAGWTVWEFKDLDNLEALVYWRM